MLKSHPMRQDPLNDTLAHNKERALIALVAGETITKAAAAANVDRRTVTLWMEHDELFIEAYRKERRVLRQSVAVTLESAAVAAIASLRQICVGSDSEANRIEAGKVIVQTLIHASTNQSPLLRAADAESAREAAITVPARRAFDPGDAEMAANLARKYLSGEPPQNGSKGAPGASGTNGTAH